MINIDKTTKTLIFCSVFIAGIISTVLHFELISTFVFLVFVLFLILNKKLSLKFSIGLFLILLTSIFYTNYRTPNSDALSTLIPSTVTYKGVITSPLSSSYSEREKFEVSVFAVKQDNIYKKIKGHTILNITNSYNLPDIQIGDVVEARVSLKAAHVATNPGQFDYSQYLKYKRIYSLGYAESADILQVHSPTTLKWIVIQKFNHLKDKIINVHGKYLKSPNLEVLGGVVFGDYAVPVSNEVKHNFINSGLIHILAASGMNIAFVYALWFFLAKKMSFPYQFSIIVGMILVIVYSALTGFPPSVTRAALIFELVLFAKLIDRKADNLALIAFVCALMLLYDPFFICNISFQLSFIVAFGLLLFMPALSGKFVIGTPLITDTILVPIVAQVWVAPIQMFHFNTFSVYSVFSNIVVFPISEIITYLGFSSSLLSLVPIIGNKVCFLFDKCSNPFISALLFVSEFASGLPHAIEYFATPKVFSIILYYTLLILFIIALKLNFGKKILNYSLLTIAVLFVVSLIPFGLLYHDLKITVFDVGESDSILIQTPNHKNILIDTGNSGYHGFSSAKNIVIAYLRSQGIRHLDALVLTHPDKDHIGGALDILEGIKVITVYQNGEFSHSKTYKKIQKFMIKHNQKKMILNNDNSINIDKSVKIKAIRNVNADQSSHNDNSIILYLTYKHFSALFMGDAEKNSLLDIENTVKSPVTLLKVGHHGSKRSVDSKFLSILKPRISVISVGKNRYGHPKRNILSLLNDYHSKTYRTDKDSAVIITTNGNSIKVNTFLSNNK